MRSLIFILILYSFSAEGQKMKKEKLPPPATVEADIEIRYEHTHRYTIAQLRKRFLLKKSKQVLLISYTCTNEECISTSIVDNNDTQPAKAPVNKVRHGVDTLGYKEVREIMILNSDQVDSLMTMMYNVRQISGPRATLGCYYPRNSIVFLNALNEKVAFIDMCFECYNLVASHKDLKADETLKGKYEMMREFFYNAGIMYGTVTKNPLEESK